MPAPIDLNAADLDTVWAELTRTGLHRRLLQLAHDEDLGPDAGGRGPRGGGGDITSRVTIPEDAQGQAALVVREPGILAGLRILPDLLHLFAPNTACQTRAADGHPAEADTIAAVLQGPVCEILAAERTLLNLVGRLSGVATRTREFVSAIEGTGARIYDTRKTTPGLRVLEKYAVRCGGGCCHRIGLFDAVLIKDNHIAAEHHASADAFTRWLTNAAAKARALGLEAGQQLKFVECEVDTLSQFGAILAAGGCNVDIVLLDNMPPDELRRAVEMRDRAGFKGKLELEASGGVRLDTVRAIAETGVERISAGALTHSVSSLDVALDLT